VNPLTLLRLPVMPLRALVQLAELIRTQAEQELYDPAAVRRQLEEADEARQAGQLSVADAAQAEADATRRLGVTDAASRLGVTSGPATAAAQRGGQGLSDAR
jgi:hypothetical protein